MSTTLPPRSLPDRTTRPPQPSWGLAESDAAPSADSGVREELALVFGIDYRTLAVFRIGLAVLLLGDLAWRAADLTAFYTDQGTLSRVARIQLLETGNSTGHAHWWSLHMLSGQAWAQGLLFGVAALAAGALLIGYRTWLATFVSWVLLTSLHARNPVILQGGDVLLRMLVFWSLFIPLGANWSIDRLVHPRRDLPRSALSIGTFALLLQVASLYVFSVVMKNHPRWHSEFTAVYYALQIDQLTTPFGRWLAQFPEVGRLLTWGTYYFELLGPMLAFLPWLRGWLRFATVLTFWGFHFGLSLCFELGPFPYYCYVAWLAFVPGCVWDALDGWMPSLRTRRQALADSVRSVWHQVFQRLEGTAWGPTVPSMRLGVAGSLACAAALSIMLVWNFRECTSTTSIWWRLMPVEANVLGRATGIEQRWDMFSPPLTDDGWYCMEGTLRNGERVNLWQPGQPLPTKKPADVAAMYPRERWRKYLMNLCATTHQDYRRGFVDWLAYRWNTEFSGGRKERQVKTVRLRYFLERTPAPGATPPPVEDLLLWDWVYGDPAATNVTRVEPSATVRNK